MIQESRLGNHLDFRNGKSSPPRTDGARFAVFGSNGVIGRSDEHNAGPQTIVIGRVGTYCGSVHYSPEPCWVTDNAIVASAKIPEEARFWFLFLRANDLNNYRAGSGQPLLNQTILNSISVKVPDGPMRLSIAFILGALDDKIAINHRTNETLERMAQAIFQECFVDFGPTRAKMEGRAPYLNSDIWSVFPDCLDKEEKPQGWSLGSVDDVAALSTGAVNPQATPDRLFLHHSIPAYDEGQTPTVDTGANIKSNKTLVPKGSVLLSKLNPEIPRVWLTDVDEHDNAVCSTEFLVMLPKAPAGRAFLYGLFHNHTFREILRGMVTGTSSSHQRVKPRGVLDLELIRPSCDALTEYEKIVGPLLDRLIASRRETGTLSSLRDTLLPKLISGEVSIHDAEKIVGEAA